MSFFPSFFSSSSSSSSASSSSSSSSPTKFGYGKNPNPSRMQCAWQTEHPTFLAITKHTTVREHLRSNPLRDCIVDPALLLPLVSPALWYDAPDLSHYVQLPVYLWVPEFFLPHLVSFMPCPITGCNGRTSRQRWHSGGPLVIHGIHSAMYLHCWEYECSLHKGKSFNGWDHRCLLRLPPAASSLFRFVLSKQEGVTMEVHNRIVEARVAGHSLNALRRELVRNRYTRMYDTITAYYQHCEQDKLRKDPLVTALHHPSRGATPVYPPNASHPPQP
jgi:hypothetical protein